MRERREEGMDNVRSRTNPGQRGSHGEAPPCGDCGYYGQDGERPPPYNYPEQPHHPDQPPPPGWTFNPQQPPYEDNNRDHGNRESSGERLYPDLSECRCRHGDNRHSNTKSRPDQPRVSPDDVTEKNGCCGGVMAIGGLFFAFMLLRGWIVPIAGLALLAWSWRRLRGNGYHGYRESGNWWRWPGSYYNGGRWGRFWQCDRQGGYHGNRQHNYNCSRSVRSPWR